MNVFSVIVIFLKLAVFFMCYIDFFFQLLLLFITDFLFYF